MVQREALNLALRFGSGMVNLACNFLNPMVGNTWVQSAVLEDTSKVRIGSKYSPCFYKIIAFVQNCWQSVSKLGAFTHQLVDPILTESLYLCTVQTFRNNSDFFNHFIWFRRMKESSNGRFIWIAWMSCTNRHGMDREGHSLNLIHHDWITTGFHIGQVPSL